MRDTTTLIGLSNALLRSREAEGTGGCVFRSLDICDERKNTVTGSSLFNYGRYENETCIPYRPLGEASDFVVEQMPERLAEIRAGIGNINKLIDDIELIIGEIEPLALERILVDTQARELAAFDAKFMEIGIVHSDGIPPENLVDIVNILAKATDQLPVVTYEDLIFINPPHDRRRFTNGRAGQSESDFYEGHRIIENHLSEVLNRFRWAIYFLAEKRKEGVDKAHSTLQKALVQLRSILEYIDTIGMNMNKDDFTLFRKYFQSHPIRKTKGVSGAFSASIPLADLLLGGENLSEDRLRYLCQNKPYFSKPGRKEIDQALVMVQKGLTLNRLYQAVGQPETLGTILQELSYAMRIFRGKHYKAVEYQLPKVIAGKEVGTSGETEEFLHKRIDTRHICEL